MTSKNYPYRKSVAKTIEYRHAGSRPVGKAMQHRVVITIRHSQEARARVYSNPCHVRGYNESILKGNRSLVITR